MKILHINSYYVKDFFYENLYDYQINNNLDIDVLVHKYIDTYNDFNKRNCIVISPYNKVDKFFFNSKHNKLYNEIKKLELNYDLIHAHTLFSNGMCAYKIYLDTFIPYIVAIRSTDIDIFFKYFYHIRKIGLKILLNAKRIIFISESYKDKLFKYIDSKYHKLILEKSIVITNGIDNYYLENKGIVKEITNKNEFTILHVARINKNKNAKLIVEAIKYLNTLGYNIKLQCIGKVEDEKLLIKLLKNEFVCHYSFMPKEKLIKYYKNSTLFILPSKNETYGISLLEAMSQGIPIIYTKNEGFDKQFDEGTIGYSTTNDYKELSNKILKILDNYNKISTNCINEIQNYSWDIIGQKYFDLYNEVIYEK